MLIYYKIKIYSQKIPQLPMSDKTLPFTQEQLNDLCNQYETPFHVYDEKAIRENAKKFYKAFSWVPGGFKNYFAVKALPNPTILEILKEEGMGADCSSLPEIILSQKAGISGSDIVFTSNDTPAEEYKKAKEAGAVINLDDISHIDFLKEAAGLPELICFRFNPGKMKEGNAIIGEPQEAKYGFTREQLTEGFRKCKEYGIKKFGIHTMVASNELDGEYFIETARILFQAIREIHEELDINFDFVNLGGGIGIPYKPEDEAVDLQMVSDGIKKAYDEIIKGTDLEPLKIVMECGRMVTGPYGYLFSKVLHLKKTYKNYVGLDACMTDLMRPALYGAYHHITLPGKENSEKGVYDITGSLCENNDKFAINRKISHPKPGDIVVIHDTGAHGWAMGFNYNGKLRHAEILITEDGGNKMIRRAETLEDYFSTLSF